MNRAEFRVKPRGRGNREETESRRCFSCSAMGYARVGMRTGRDPCSGSVSKRKRGKIRILGGGET